MKDCNLSKQNNNENKNTGNTEGWTALTAYISVLAVIVTDDTN